MDNGQSFGGKRFILRLPRKPEIGLLRQRNAGHACFPCRQRCGVNVPMIFGFNTDIATIDTVYHVQTEVREQLPRLESQIFVRGRCIGKRAGVLPESATEEQIQELARAQHRRIVEAVRAGLVDDVLKQEKGEELSVELLSSRRLPVARTILRLRVLSGGSVAPGARVSVNWKIASASGVLEERLTDEAGVVELRLKFGEAAVELDI